MKIDIITDNEKSSKNKNNMSLREIDHRLMLLNALQ